MFVGRSATRRSWLQKRVFPETSAIATGGLFDSIRDKLPPYRLHWDGQPPRAFLIDARTDEILAPPVLSRRTMLLNRNAVLWTPERCGFVISRTLYDANRQHLAIKFEVPAPRGMFYLFFGLGSVLFALTLLVYFGHSLLFIGIETPRARLGGWVQAIVLLVAAALLFPIHFPGYPLNASMGDEANVNSFAAALDRPDVFQRDQLLSERRNFDWYTPLYVQWVRLLQSMGFRYDTNRSFAVFFSALVGLVGYQRLFGTRPAHPGSFTAALCYGFKTMIPPTEVWERCLRRPARHQCILPWALVLPWVHRYASAVLATRCDHRAAVLRTRSALRL
jgi:hypothetical protein